MGAHPHNYPTINLPEPIWQKVRACPPLASLRSISVALIELSKAEESYLGQIAEIIRRDPSLTARLLKLVNSVFFSLAEPISSIEDAVFYLGIRQLRELAVSTPVIEELTELGADEAHSVGWRQMWQHSIATGILTRDVLNLAGVDVKEDTDYIAGLLQNVGKIVMAHAFPKEFAQLNEMEAESLPAYCALETELVGATHAQLGAAYLSKQHIAPLIVHAVQYHHNPEAIAEAFPEVASVAAAVQVADYLVRSAGLLGMENTPMPEAGADIESAIPGWEILFGQRTEATEMELASLKHSLMVLPGMLKGMV